MAYILTFSLATPEPVLDCATCPSDKIDCSQHGATMLNMIDFDAE